LALEADRGGREPCLKLATGQPTAIKFAVRL
jgi:hypothetical protein